jgi:hypothetical protein
MPQTRVRLTVRRLMIAVAVVALLVFGEQTRRRWLDYRARYEDYEFFAREMRASAEHPHLGLCGMGRRLSERELAELLLEEAESSLRYAAYFDALRAKYVAAMRRPWLTVEPDAPEPE